MTVLLSIVLIVSVLGFFAVIYAVKEGWKDYKLSIVHNGWRLISARGQLRSQLFALVESSMLTSAIVLALYYNNADLRPLWVSLVLRFLILVPITFIGLNAILEVRTRRKVLRSK